jgi:transposase InsO family protein
MIELLRRRDPIVPLSVACAALAVSLATAKRHLGPPKAKAPREPRPASPRKLSEEQRAAIVATMHSERFIDQTPHQVVPELLEEGTYLGSVRTIYRVLADNGESRERRDQRAPRSHAVPRLVATKPNACWTWDITKLATFEPGVMLNLYLVLDLYSRFPVAWMVAERENSALSKQLLAEAITRYAIPPGTLTVHNDRGAPMTATGFVELLGELGAKPSKSRPRVSNDNAFSEACFKTVKYQPDFPGRFKDVHDARQWLSEFFGWYADQHRHSGLAYFTPADVFFGRVDEVAAARQRTLDDAYERHPERFVRGRPLVRRPPAIVAINPVDPDDAPTSARASDAVPLASPAATSTESAITLPGLANAGTDSDPREVDS